MITYDDFAKLEMRVGTVTNCTPVEGSVKLFKLEVDFGPLGTRTILTGMAPYYQPEDFNGLKTLFLFNLEYRKMMGMESQGMLLSVGLDHSKKPTLVKLDDTAENGDGIN
jgi:methionyl-tRNA synthetase